MDNKLLSQIKRAFVPMPGGQHQPVAGASPMTAGMNAPVGPGGGPPMDPGGMPPMDPGGMPPMDPGGMPPMDPGGMPPMDPGMMPPPEEMLAGGEPPPGQITMSVPEFIELVSILQGGIAVKKDKEDKEKQSAGSSDQKLDRLIGALQQAGLAV